MQIPDGQQCLYNYYSTVFNSLGLFLSGFTVL